MTVASPTHSVYMLQNVFTRSLRVECLAAESLLAVFHGSALIFSGAPGAQVVVMLRRR